MSFSPRDSLTGNHIFVLEGCWVLFKGLDEVIEVNNFNGLRVAAEEGRVEAMFTSKEHAAQWLRAARPPVVEASSRPLPLAVRSQKPGENFVWVPEHQHLDENKTHAGIIPAGWYPKKGKS